MKRDQMEAAQLVVEGRKLLDKGDLDGAAKLALTAEKLHGPYSSWLSSLELGDQPRKLIADINTMRAKQHKTDIPKGPTDRVADNGGQNLRIEDPGPKVGDNPPQPTDSKNAPHVPDHLPQPDPQAGSNLAADLNKQKAMRLLAEAKQLQQERRLLEARQKATEARGLGATFNIDEYGPDRAILELGRLCRQEIENLVQDAVDHANNSETNPPRLQKAVEALVRARELAQGFGFETQPIDGQLDAIRQMRPPPQGIGPGGQPGLLPKTDGTTGLDNANPSHPDQGQAPTGTPQQQEPEYRGKILLEQARAELQRGQLQNAKMLVFEAGGREEYRVGPQAAALLKEIEVEEFRQQQLAANRNFDAAWRAYTAGNLQEARMLFYSLEYRLLDESRRAKFQEVMQTPEMKPPSPITREPTPRGTDLPAQGDRGLPPDTAKIRVTDQNPHTDRLAPNDRPPPADQPPPGPRKPSLGSLEETKGIIKINFEKLQQKSGEVNGHALELFRNPETADEAIDLLRYHLTEIDEAVLDSDSADMLRRPIMDRIKQLTDIKSQREREQPAPPNPIIIKNQKVKDKLEREKQAAAAKQQQIAEMMDKFHAAYKAANYKEAARYAKMILEIDHNNPQATTALKMAETQIRIGENDEIKDRGKKMVERVILDGKDVGPAASTKDPLRRDNQLDKQHQQNPAESGIYPIIAQSDKDRLLEYRLTSLVNVKFVNATLEQVAADLRDQYGINIELDKQAIEQKSGLHVTRPFLSCSLEQVSLKSVLNFLLHQAGLTYVIKDEILLITTENNASEKLVTRIYNVQDIVIRVQDYPMSEGLTLTKVLENVGKGPTGVPGMSGTSPFTGPTTLGGGAGVGTPGGPAKPAISKRGPGQTIEHLLMNLITNAIAPMAWSDMGGPGTINYFPTGALIVNQTPAIHAQIADFLCSLRKLQEQEVSVEVRIISIADSFFERIGLDFNVAKNSGSNPLAGLINNAANGAGGVISGIGGNGVSATIARPSSVTSALSIPIRPTDFNNMVNPLNPVVAGAAGGLNMGLAFLSDIQVYLFLAAVQGDQRTKIMQSPHLTLFNGETATVAMQDHQLLVTNFTMYQQNGTTVLAPQPQDFPTGVTLTIQAVISADRRSVRLALEPTLTSMTSTNVPLFPINAAIAPAIGFEGGAAGQPVVYTNYIQQPTFNTISLQTTVTVPDGSTVLLGGLKRLSEGRSETGTPIISKIPYVGKLFTDTSIDREVESLIIMVTPRIITNAEPECSPLTGPGQP